MLFTFQKSSRAALLYPLLHEPHPYRKLESSNLSLLGNRVKHIHSLLITSAMIASYTLVDNPVTDVGNPFSSP